MGSTSRIRQRRAPDAWPRALRRSPNRLSSRHRPGLIDKLLHPREKPGCTASTTRGVQQRVVERVRHVWSETAAESDAHLNRRPAFAARGGLVGTKQPSRQQRLAKREGRVMNKSVCYEQPI